jgi:hypothetical protein
VNKPPSQAPKNFFVSIVLECSLFSLIHFKVKAVKRLLDLVFKAGQLRKADTSPAVFLAMATRANLSTSERVRFWGADDIDRRSKGGLEARR